MKIKLQFFGDDGASGTDPAPGTDSAPAAPDAMATITANFQKQIADLKKQIADRDETIVLLSGGAPTPNKTPGGGADKPAFTESFLKLIHN